jgi:hypothetical protein
MPTPFAVFLASDHEICELADELIHDDKMHLDCLLTEEIIYFQIGGLTPKAADAFGFGKVEKKTGTDALAYLGRFSNEAVRRSKVLTQHMGAASKTERAILDDAAWEASARKSDSALFAESDIAPALSATQQADNFAAQFVGGGA